MAQLVDLLVYIGPLLYVGIGTGDIGFRLVIIVIADKILYSIVGEELFKFSAQLGSQGLVMADDQGGPLHPLDNIGHGAGLAASGNAEECLLSQAHVKP